jgi:hypothetical protein
MAPLADVLEHAQQAHRQMDGGVGRAPLGDLVLTELLPGDPFRHDAAGTALREEIVHRGYT